VRPTLLIKLNSVLCNQTRKRASCVTHRNVLPLLLLRTVGIERIVNSINTVSLLWRRTDDTERVSWRVAFLSRRLYLLYASVLVRAHARYHNCTSVCMIL
jgi:hypothetical protein